MKNWKKMIVTAAAFGSLALFAGCTTASAVSLEEAKEIVQQTVGAPDAVVVELEKDRDDSVYELEVIIDGVGYEFEVDSRTGQVREVDREDGRPVAQTTPASTEAARITLEEAKAIAYTHAGVSESDARDRSYERDDGIYEIDFEHDGWEYDYDIAPDGSILKSEKEPERTAAAQPQPAETTPVSTEAARITLEEAKAIAYTHAGVSESDARDRSYERDDGIYEIDFEHDGWEYDYDIAPDGTILKSEKEPEPAAAAQAQPAETTPAAQPARISREEALTIALNHAGLTADQIRDRDVEWDDGRWEVSFESGRTDYDYDISADGSILRWEKENDD